MKSPYCSAMTSTLAEKSELGMTCFQGERKAGSYTRVGRPQDMGSYYYPRRNDLLQIPKLIFYLVDGGRILQILIELLGGRCVLFCLGCSACFCTVPPKYKSPAVVQLNCQFLAITRLWLFEAFRRGTTVVPGITGNGPIRSHHSGFAR